MSLTANQLTRLRADLGLRNDDPVFDAVALNDMWDEAGELYTTAGAQYAAAVLIGLRRLQINAAKDTDYAAGQTREQASQVFKHLSTMITLWQQQLARYSQVLIVGMKSEPPTVRDVPLNNPDRPEQWYAQDIDE